MTVGRRDLLKAIATGGAAAAMGDLLVTQPSRAAELKRAGAKEFTTVCNFSLFGWAARNMPILPREELAP
jgi:hypothetical protein